MKKVSPVRRITVTAALGALGIVLLYLASLLPSGKIGVAGIAGLLPGVAVLIMGRSAGWSVYAVTSALALLLVPNRSLALLYVAFLGYWPMLKSMIERLRYGWAAFLVKLAVFNVPLTLGVLLFSEVVFDLAGKEYAYWLIFIAANAAFIAYDICFSLLILSFWKRLREMFK